MKSIRDLLMRITEDQIADIIGLHYRVPASDVCLYHDYEFVRRGNDKKRRDFIYGIVDFRNQKEEEDANDNWISVKERLPAESGNYLIVVSGTTELDYYSETIGWDCDGVTHWMPLPEPPKEE